MDKTKIPLALSGISLLIACVSLVISINKGRDVGRYQLCPATIKTVNLNPATAEAGDWKDPKIFKFHTKAVKHGNI